MISKTTVRFRKAYEKLPGDIKRQAKKKYDLWKYEPYNSSLKFKRISGIEEIYSIRISKGWRALGLKKDETMIWFWIGSHAEYDKLVKIYSKS